MGAPRHNTGSARNGEDQAGRSRSYENMRTAVSLAEMSGVGMRPTIATPRVTVASERLAGQGVGMPSSLAAGARNIWLTTRR